MSLVTINEGLAADLKIRINDLRSREGSLLYLLFDDSSGFPDDPKKSLAQGSIPLSEAPEGPPEIHFHGLPRKHYAFTVIHDENNNGKLDTNFLGLPKEGFGFSRNPAIFFGPPGFERCKFDHSGNGLQEVKMRYL